jgi:hypothetical protein
MHLDGQACRATRAICQVILNIPITLIFPQPIHRKCLFYIDFD